jgi:hypothetical protein
LINDIVFVVIKNCMTSILMVLVLVRRHLTVRNRNVAAGAAVGFVDANVTLPVFSSSFLLCTSFVHVSLAGSAAAGARLSSR